MAGKINEGEVVDISKLKDSPFFRHFLVSKGRTETHLGANLAVVEGKMLRVRKLGIGWLGL